jgi:hypothetical protein
VKAVVDQTKPVVATMAQQAAPSDNDSIMTTARRSNPFLGRGSNSDASASSFSNMFRRIAGSRRNDYVTDAAATAAATAASLHATTGSAHTNPSRQSSTELPPEAAGPPTFADKRRTFLSKIIYNHIWQILMIVLSFILLFGPQIQHLFFPASADFACDIVYSATFIFFCLDIIIRLGAEKDYFQFDLFALELGSFLFFCDIISTLALLYDIQWIGAPQFEEMYVNILLNEFGVPVSIVPVYYRMTTANHLTSHMCSCGLGYHRFLGFAMSIHPHQSQWNWVFL